MLVASQDATSAQRAGNSLHEAQNSMSFELGRIADHSLHVLFIPGAVTNTAYATTRNNAWQPFEPIRSISLPEELFAMDG